MRVRGEKTRQSRLIVDKSPQFRQNDPDFQQPSRHPEKPPRPRCPTYSSSMAPTLIYWVCGNLKCTAAKPCKTLKTYWRPVPSNRGSPSASCRATPDRPHPSRIQARRRFHPHQSWRVHPHQHRAPRRAPGHEDSLHRGASVQCPRAGTVPSSFLPFRHCQRDHLRVRRIRLRTRVASRHPRT